MRTVMLFQKLKKKSQNHPTKILLSNFEKWSTDVRDAALVIYYATTMTKLTTNEGLSDLSTSFFPKKFKSSPRFLRAQLWPSLTTTQAVLTRILVTPLQLNSIKIFSGDYSLQLSFILQHKQLILVTRSLGIWKLLVLHC